MYYLNLYSSWSRQQVSLHKSGVFFSQNIQGLQKKRINETLEMGTMKGNEKYLGNPMFPSRNGMKDFDFYQREDSRPSGKLAGKTSFLGWSRYLMKAFVLAIPQ